MEYSDCILKSLLHYFLTYLNFLTISFPLLSCRLVKVKLGLNNDAPFFSKVKSFFKTPKANEQDIKPDQQFTFKDDEGNPHDIMLIKLNEDASAKLPTIQLPAAECSRPEVNQPVKVGGWGAKTADVKSEQH